MTHRIGVAEMTHRLSVFWVALLFTALVSASAPAQYPVMQNTAEFTVIEATTVFSQATQMAQNEIPRNLLADAQAIAIVPSMLRGAFVFGVSHGKGVLLIRDANRAWQAPRFISVTGGSVGYQIGVSATDLILVFRTPQSVQNLLQGTLKVGVDASAAAGPIGRQTSAGTDLQMGAEILSYSRARGAFVGVSIDGSSITLDPASEAMYYQPPGVFPASAATLLQWVNAYTVTQQLVAPAPAPAAGQIPTPTAGGWVAAGQRSGDAESTRQQLDSSSRQLFANLDGNWQRYLALPQEVYVPNQVPNPQAMQQALSRYEEVANRPEYAALKARPEFTQTVESLRRMSEVRTASNTSLSLPPPPK
jgi:lipid-binding SYLF domain-containing protein